jgi:TonB family protein
MVSRPAAVAFALTSVMCGMALANETVTLTYPDGVRMRVVVPEYPSRELRRGEAGEVIAAFLVVAGEVENLRVIRTTGRRFQRALRNVMHTWEVGDSSEQWRESGRCNLDRRGVQVIFDPTDGSVTVNPAIVETDPGARIQQSWGEWAEHQVELPTLTGRVRTPSFPGRHQSNATPGSAAVIFLVGIDGQVSDVTIVDSDPDELYGESLALAVEDWRFEPGAVDGENAPIRLCQRYDFYFRRAPLNDPDRPDFDDEDGPGWGDG